MFNFERLTVWQRAMELADRVYSLTRRFPSDEKFGLTSQMRRSAVSVASNIAEGCSRHSSADQARFWEIASGSLFELLSQCLIAQRQGFITAGDLDTLRSMALEQTRMLSGLRRAGSEKMRDSSS